jgi:methyl-accepting chemotaxis protein
VLTKQIQEATSQAVASMGETVHEVEKGSKLASEAGVRLKDIVGEISQAGTDMRSIATAAHQLYDLSQQVMGSVESVTAVAEDSTTAAQEMSDNADQVTAAIEAVASVAEENAASAEEVSASVDEMTASSEQISDAAHSLSRIALQLKETIVQFRT